MVYFNIIIIYIYSFVRDGMLFIKPTLTVDRYGSENFLSNGKLNLYNEGCNSQKDTKCTV